VTVDNGSNDGSADYLRDLLTGVEILETGANLGFSGGCNVGISRALAGGAEFVLLVNSDAVLHPDTLTELLDAAHRHPDAGILAPVLLSREEPDRVASAGIRFSSATGRMIHRACGQRIGQLPARDLTDVDAVSGCVMLVRSRVFGAIGFFDEEYFFSFEDLDLCLRARAAGFRVVLVDGAVAYHQGGLSIGRRSPRRVYFATRNHLRLSARVLRSSAAATVLRGALIVAWNAAYAITSPDVPTAGGLAAVARGTWHHLTRRYGPG
jgi:GT2 family glycosyltransferase